MQKLGLKHTLSQKLSPQKLQLIKLLQVPSAAMQARIEQEIASNPALEEDVSEELLAAEGLEEEDSWSAVSQDNIGHGQKMRENKQTREEQDRGEGRLRNSYSLGEELLKQLSFLKLDEKQCAIGAHLIGSIEPDGYLRRDLEAITNELSFTQYIDTSVQEVEAILRKIQHFDPPGIGARDLQECLLIQLHRRSAHSPAHNLAIQIVTECFEGFTKKHYEKIAEKLKVENQDLLKEALLLITKLDPKPGSRLYTADTPQITLSPDFIVRKQGEQLHVTLANYRPPMLRTSRNYLAILHKYKDHPQKDKKMQEAATFAKKKLEAATWFIDAVNQREHTLLKTMKAIAKLQHDFFMQEEARYLKPMVLKHVAEKIEMDVSTVSRIVNNKSVQTDFGVYPLKYFFTEAIATASGESVSNRAVKKIIEEVIQQENKQQPYADDKIAALLKAKGYPVARRTVAKYREQLQLPVARLRKAL